MKSHLWLERKAYQIMEDFGICQESKVMENGGTKQIPYEIPTHVVYTGEPLWKSERNKGKYFDLKKDMQAGLSLGSMEEMEQEYIKEVCNGAPWKQEASVPCV